MRRLCLLLFLLWGAGLQAQDPHIQRLATQLQSRDPGIRRQAARSLGEVGQAQGVQLLRAALVGEREAPVRLEMVRALRNISFLRYPGYQEALQALQERSSDQVEPDEHVRLRATEALWEAGKKDLLDPVPFLRRNLGDRSQRLRLAAVEMLRKLGTPPTVEVLGQAALDQGQSETIRLKAVEALGAVAQVDLGDAGRRAPEANIEAAGHLGAQPLSPPAVLAPRHQLQIGYLAALLRAPNTSSTLALRAVKSIGQVKDKSAVPVLREVMATHRDQAVRLQAERVLSHVLARQYE